MPAEVLAGFASGESRSQRSQARIMQGSRWCRARGRGPARTIQPSIVYNPHSAAVGPHIPRGKDRFCTSLRAPGSGGQGQRSRSPRRDRTTGPDRLSPPQTRLEPVRLFWNPAGRSAGISIQMIRRRPSADPAALVRVISRKNSVRDVASGEARPVSIDIQESPRRDGSSAPAAVDLFLSTAHSN
jgi:hypothetical protein